MTWLGKILTVLIFLGALVWAYFTVQTFVLSTNWKIEAEKYKNEYNQAKQKRQDDYNRHLVAEDALRRQLAIVQASSESQGKTIETLSASAKKTAVDIGKIQDQYDAGDVQALKLQANLDASVKESKAVRERNYFLEDNAVKLIVAAEEARGEMIRARNSEKLAQSIASDNAKKVEELIVKVTELKASGGSGAATVLRTIDKPAPPVLSNLRGEVTDVAGDLLTISVGIDAGLGVGTVLDIYRTDGGGRYLGTVRVTDAFNLYPKQAVVKFTPANAVPLERLRPEELPKKGDLIKPPEGPGR